MATGRRERLLRGAPWAAAGRLDDPRPLSGVLAWALRDVLPAAFLGRLLEVRVEACDRAPDEVRAGACREEVRPRPWGAGACWGCGRLACACREVPRPFELLRGRACC